MAITNDTPQNNRRMAMLIDSENASAALIEKMLAETSKYGMMSIRRAYGDWTTSNMNGWKETLHVHAIQPIQQFRYTVGKNSSDSAMIIDAMDILYSNAVTGFCLVSSDSDYTRLATRIRESGLFVMGIGVSTTPRAFVNACEVFVVTENLVEQKKTQTKKLDSMIPLFKKAFDLAVLDNGWAFLGSIGHHLRQLDPSFDARTFGFKQLSALVRGNPKMFEVNDTKAADGTSVIYVKIK